MRAPSTALIGRTAFTLAYLVVLAIAGAPGVALLLLGVALVAVWAAPLLLGEHRRRALGAPRVVVAEDGVRAA
jgi:hypothetical protein